MTLIEEMMRTYRITFEFCNKLREKKETVKNWYATNAAAPTMLAALKELDDRWDELPRDLQQVVIKAIEAAEELP